MNSDKTLQEQLSRLGEQIGSQPSIADVVMQRIEQETVAPIPRIHRLRRILMKAAMPVAASILIAIIVWFAVSQGSGTPAYGLQDFERQLAEARSLHVKGWYTRQMSSGQVIKLSTEKYYQRPMTYWQTYYSVGKDTVTAGYRISDGKQFMEIDDGEKTCTMGKELPLHAEMWVEYCLQHFFRQDTVGGLSGFKKVGTETVKGIKADVYEKISPARHKTGSASRFVMYFNPATGWPIRTISYETMPGQQETFDGESTDIEPNAQIPANLFSFEPPAGYTLIQQDRTPDDIAGTWGGSVNTLHGNVRLAFNIDDRAILMCWSCYDTEKTPAIETDLEGPAGRRLALTAKSGMSGRTYGNYFLRADAAEKFHWRWSLVVPEDGMPLNGDEPELTFCKNGGTLGAAIQPRCLPPEHLADLIVKTQQLTLPANASAEAVFTLEKLEALIRQIQSQGRAANDN